MVSHAGKVTVLLRLNSCLELGHRSKRPNSRVSLSFSNGLLIPVWSAIANKQASEAKERMTALSLWNLDYVHH
jgi:hypothetical protein